MTLATVPHPGAPLDNLLRYGTISHQVDCLILVLLPIFVSGVPVFLLLGILFNHITFFPRHLLPHMRMVPKLYAHMSLHCILSLNLLLYIQKA